MDFSSPLTRWLDRRLVACFRVDDVCHEFFVCYVGKTDVHRMEAARTNRGLRFTFTCLDGTEGRHCRHRIALFLGDASAMVRVDEAAVGSLMAMAKGPLFLQSVHMPAQAEGAFAEARLDLDRAKRVIATILEG